MASLTTLRTWWSSYRCKGSAYYPNINVLGTIQDVAPPWYDAMKALDIVLRYKGYRARSVGTYNCRAVTGGSAYSAHAYAIAIDIDPHLNPYYGYRRLFRWSDTAFTLAQINAVEAIKNVQGERMWEWGGYWGSIKDYMHFEPNVPPYRSTVRWETVAGHFAAPGPTIPEEADVVIKVGAIGNFMRVLQQNINGWLWTIGGAPIPVDGHFSAHTLQQVQQYQKAANRPITGDVDWLTWNLLERYSPFNWQIPNMDPPPDGWGV